MSLLPRRQQQTGFRDQPDPRDLLAIPRAETIQAFNARFIELAMRANLDSDVESVLCAEGVTYNPGDLPTNRVIFSISLEEEPTERCSLHAEKTAFALDFLAYATSLYRQNCFGVAWSLLLPAECVHAFQVNQWPDLYKMAQRCELYGYVSVDGSTNTKLRLATYQV